jgi:hypothetical protein
MHSRLIKLQLRNNHLFLDLGGDFWVYDTGCPTSFGSSLNDLIDSGKFVHEISVSGKSVNANIISAFTGVTVAGMLGTDVLNKYDHVIDLSTSMTELLVAESLPPPSGAMGLDLELLAGVLPSLNATIGEKTRRYIFDTGAQLSYHVGPRPRDAKPGMPTNDFWIPIGEYQTETYHTAVKLDGFEVNLRFGIPPKALSDALNDMNVQGILGNELLIGRRCGYFPRSRKLYLQDMHGPSLEEPTISKRGPAITNTPGDLSSYWTDDLIKLLGRL